MKLFKAEFIENIIRTEDTESFRFIPEEKINFLPGQFLKLIFDEGGFDNRELNKYLSFSCAPHREYIEVTKKISGSGFSQRLKSLSTGDKVLVQAPFGNCTFSPDYAKIAFIIGGIGITPVISIIENIAHNKFPAQMALFYSNKNDGNIAFRRELDAWSVENNSLLKVFYAVTDSRPRDPACFYGRIDRGFIESRDAAFKERMIFIFGPPVMVRAMDELCREIGCPAEMIRKESFIGY